MSEPKLDLARRIYESMDTDIAAALELLTPDVEWVNPPDAVVGGTLSGHSGFTEALTGVADSFSQWRHEPIGFTEIGDQVLVDLVFHATGRGSGLELDKPEFHLWSFRDGKLARLQWFNRREEALAAADQAGS
jgi:ketosteroid isomerase-like protein